MFRYVWFDDTVYYGIHQLQYTVALAFQTIKLYDRLGKVPSIAEMLQEKMDVLYRSHQKFN